MNTNTPSAVGVRSVKLLTAGVLLIALLLVCGTACGGGDDAGEGVSTSSETESKVSAEPRADEGSKVSDVGLDSDVSEPTVVQDLSSVPDDDKAGKNGSTSSEPSDRETSESSETENKSSSEVRADEGNKVSGVSLDSDSYEPISVRDLGSVPNLDYRWVVMLDPSAFLAGEVPQPVAYAVGLHDTRKILYDAIAIDDINAQSAVLPSELGIPLREFSISTDAVENIIPYQGVISYQEEEYILEVVAIRGDFDFGQIRKSLSENGFRLKDRDLSLELWSGGGHHGDIVLIESDKVVMIGYGIDALLDPSYGGVYRERDKSPQTILQADFGISLADVDTIVSIDEETEAFAILGQYEPDDIKNAMFQGKRVSEEKLDYEVWEVSKSGPFNELTVALVQDELYTTGGDFEDSQEFLDAVAAGEELRDARDNPLTIAMEKAGTGWLVGAWAGPWYCEEWGPAAFSGCQATALAVSTGTDSVVQANWVTLFDSEDSARSAGRVTLNDIAEADLFSGIPEAAFAAAITDFKVSTDGEFVVVEVSVMDVLATWVMSFLLYEMLGRW